jgi:hypothetical protein
MKKIFTLIFSLGLLTTAFAQSGYRQQNRNKGNVYQQSQYSHDSRHDNNNINSYGGNQQWNNNDKRDQHDQYAYNQNDRDRNYRDRDQSFSPKYKNARRGYNYDEPYQPVRVPLLQIIFGIGGR